MCNLVRAAARLSFARVASELAAHETGFFVALRRKLKRSASSWSEDVKLRKIYSALLTADLASAEDWYTRLLGRGPDNRPMDTLVQWELANESGLALSTDAEIAGRGVLFLYVDDIAVERGRLEPLGIVFGDDIEGEYSTLAQVRDPDGNLLTLATPPSRPFPAA